MVDLGAAQADIEIRQQVLWRMIKPHAATVDDQESTAAGCGFKSVGCGHGWL